MSETCPKFHANNQVPIIRYAKHDDPDEWKVEAACDLCGTPLKKFPTSGLLGVELEGFVHNPGRCETMKLRNHIATLEAEVARLEHLIEGGMDELKDFHNSESDSIIDVAEVASLAYDILSARVQKLEQERMKLAEALTHPEIIELFVDGKVGDYKIRRRAHEALALLQPEGSGSGE